MSDGILQFAELSRWTGYARPGDVSKFLDGHGIRYFQGKDGPCTTMALVNAAGGLKAHGEASNSPYEPAIFRG